MSLEEADLKTVATDEQLARFILFSKWVRTSEQTVKPEAFIPYPRHDLSVTRHKNLPEQNLWQIGQDVANKRSSTGHSITLYGRADINASAVRQEGLNVVPDPITKNLNHANIIGWPEGKPAQKIKALLLADASHYIPNPQSQPHPTPEIC